MGFAEGTNGGADGDLVFKVKNEKELQEVLNSNSGGLTIKVTKNMQISEDVVIESPNTTIESDGDERYEIAMDYKNDDNEVAGFVIMAPNVIIRNLTLKPRTFGEGDAALHKDHRWISISTKDNTDTPVHHVAIEDCLFMQPSFTYNTSRTAAAVIQVYQYATFVTIQRCGFMNPSNAIEMENSVNASEYGLPSMKRYDLFNDLSVTMYHCYFECDEPKTDGNSRAPKVRTGRAHVLECGFKNLNIAVNPQGMSSALVEGCFFDDCDRPLLVGEQSYDGEKIKGEAKASANSGLSSGGSINWSPPYSYSKPSGAVSKSDLLDAIGL